MAYFLRMEYANILPKKCTSYGAQINKELAPIRFIILIWVFAENMGFEPMMEINHN